MPVPAVFEIIDKTGKTIRLTKGQWLHIVQEHPQAANIDEMKEALWTPTIIMNSPYDTTVRWYYRFDKQRRQYLLVSVKYLNGNGFIITAYHVRNIK